MFLILGFGSAQYNRVAAPGSAGFGSPPMPASAGYTGAPPQPPAAGTLRCSSGAARSSGRRP